MKISILIPCHNEAPSIRRCVESCLNQSRKADQIVVVNDGSTDESGKILATFGNKIKVVTIPKATGNKSFAQEQGLKYISGDVFIATDGDTILDKNFVKRIEIDFADGDVAAVAGYVRSLKHNWLTACRELDYIVGQDLHKVAQKHLNFLFVIPGCAGAFRRDLFLRHMKFEHDTLTEDLDFTYRLHEQYFTVAYDREAIAYTQDPATLKSYVNQMRRWYAGGWQNLMKHFSLVSRPANALELSLMYIEGLTFSVLLFIFPLININFFKFFLAPYFVFMILFGIYGSIVRRRLDLLVYSPCYIFLIFINSFVFLEQFVKEVIFRKKSLFWFKPERRIIT